MSLDEKIGQLFMVAGYVDPEFAQKEIGKSTVIKDLDHDIAHYCIGGIAYVGPSDSRKQVALTNHYQHRSKYPLLIAQDLEWGVAMRLGDCMQFPKNITLGAIDDQSLIYELGKEIGRQAKLIGVHMNLSPVLDVNTEPANPVINIRSFGRSPEQVAAKGIAMFQGLQDSGIIASAKHFPGLGDMTTDPHLALPYSCHHKKRLQEVELYPFAEAIKAGVLSIQTEHVLIPSLEPDPQKPSSLSSRVIKGILKRELGFNGLVLSGALRMKALTKYFSDEAIVLSAFLAGNDMLLMPQDLPRAHQTLKKALANGKISEQEIDEKVLKILQLKEKVNLHRQRLVDLPLAKQLHSPAAKKLKTTLYQKAVTCMRDRKHLLPLAVAATDSIAYIQLGQPSSHACLNKLKQVLTVDTFCFSSTGDHRVEATRLLEKIAAYPAVILAVHPADPRRIVEIRLLNSQRQIKEVEHFRVHGLSAPLIRFIDALQPYACNVIVAFFGNPFGVHFFDDYPTLIMAYEDVPDTQHSVAEMLLYRSGMSLEKP